jgi:hypothetical protein
LLALEVAKTCESINPTPNGGRSSLTRMNTSATCRTRSALTFQEEKMRKEDQLLFGTDIMEPTRDGKLSMRKMLKRFKTRDL